MQKIYFKYLVLTNLCMLLAFIGCNAQSVQKNVSLKTPAKVENISKKIKKEDFSFENLGVKLKGTLWLPASETKKTFPAVVCVHGSGKIDRNDSYIKEFAEHFSKKGIAVLTYDKRGVGESGGDYEGGFGGSMVAYAADAISAINNLKKRDDIDSKKIGLFGVSQGGYIIPLAAAMDKRNVAFTIIVSGPVISIAEESFYSNLTGDSNGKPTGKSKEQIKKELKAYGSKGYNPYPFVEEMIKPGLWLYGGLDKSVPVEESLANLKEIKNRWKRKFTIKVFPNANHGMKESKTGNRWEKPTPTKTVEGYFETMEKWLEEIEVIK